MNSIQAAEIPIEDFLEDVVGKAMRGTGRDAASIATAAGVPLAEIETILSGKPAAGLEDVAQVLELHAPSLRKQVPPAAIDVPGLSVFNTPWHDMRVNAYVIHDPATGIGAIFDSGADARPMLQFIEAEQITVEGIFVTHTHGDHVQDMDRLTTALGPVPIFTNELEPHVGPGVQTFAAGRAFEIGALRVETATTRGHSVGGTSYFIEGLAEPIAVVGDALFALSMGGGQISFQDALRTNRKHLLARHDDTVVCPGHGPLTTIGHEKAHNPFYPEWKQD